MGLFRRLSDNSDSSSLAAAYRRRRFSFFSGLVGQLSRPLRILDVGGTRRFWEQMQFADEEGVEVTLLNITPSELVHTPVEGRTKFLEQIGDARQMPQFQANEFDIVFSNSVLEHVGELEDQRRMMEEVARVGRRYFVQTPNYYFPIEPHFHVIGFQFLPIKVRAAILQHFDLGWTARVPDRSEAEEVVRSIRLLTRRELLELCPGAKLYEEKVWGLTKSFVVYCGWE